jgi:mRNA interferase RelE/StbE
VSYEVTWSRQAKRALHQDLPESVAAACLEFILGPLAENPHRIGKPLKAELEGLHSARRGDFRVIYRINDHVITIHVLSVKHRRDVYRR